MYGKKLNLSSNGRLRLFKSLVQSLFTYGTITTSQSKAAAIKGMVDKIINLGKNKNIHLLQTYLTDKGLQKRLVSEIAPSLKNRISGYTTQVKVGVQEGDRTTLVKMSIIGNENLKPLQKKPKSQEVKESIEKAPVKEIKKPISKIKGRKNKK